MILQGKGLKVWRPDAYCPDEYAYIQAAKYLNTTPWELLNQPMYWTDWAFGSMAVENQVQKILKG